MAAANKGSRAKSSTTTKKSARKPASGNKSVEEFRDALEKSVTISRERIQEVMDDAVKRGRMTRADANKTVSNLVSKGRAQTDELVAELEKLIDRARKDVESRVAPARKRAEKAGRAAVKRARTTADPVVAEADKLRRRAGVATSSPITGYDSLNASQVKSRLSGMNKADLRKVRTQEKRGKARKGILDDIEKRLA
jgi:polyhydroxyalkanoate synthesis regulator phasin